LHCVTAVASAPKKAAVTCPYLKVNVNHILFCSAVALCSCCSICMHKKAAVTCPYLKFNVNHILSCSAAALCYCLDCICERRFSSASVCDMSLAEASSKPGTDSLQVPVYALQFTLCGIAVLCLALSHSPVAARPYETFFCVSVCFLPPNFQIKQTNNQTLYDVAGRA